MTTLVKTTKTAGLLAALAALASLSGCNKETPAPVAAVEQTAVAPAPEETAMAPAAEQPDTLFEQPIQPSPFSPRPEDVVVTVDGQPVTHGEIMQGVQMNLMQLGGRVPQQQLAQMAGQIYQNVKNTLIANILLTKAAEKSSLAVSDEEIGKEIAQIEASIAANAPEGTTLQSELAENGVKFDEWKEELRKQILVRKMIDEKTVNVEPASVIEITKFYEENVEEFKKPETVAASHILLAFKPDDTDETKAQKKAELEKIRAEILAGGDFAALATKHSDCPSSQQGGQLGTFARGQMVPEFESAAFAQETGKIGEIVETQYGYHLIRVTEHASAGVRPLAEVRDQLQRYLDGKKKQDALMAYIEELKTGADIQDVKPDLDSAAQPKE
jgi:peptidyl-prolyl cis-trans isomerase C